MGAMAPSGAESASAYLDIFSLVWSFTQLASWPVQSIGYNVCQSACVTPTLEKNFDPKKSTKKRILRNFICHLDRHFLNCLSISVKNQQRTETTNPLQIETV